MSDGASIPAGIPKTPEDNPDNSGRLRVVNYSEHEKRYERLAESIYDLLRNNEALETVTCAAGTHSDFEPCDPDCEMATSDGATLLVAGWAMSLEMVNDNGSTVLKVITPKGQLSSTSKGLLSLAAEST